MREVQGRVLVGGEDDVTPRQDSEDDYGTSSSPSAKAWRLVDEYAVSATSTENLQPHRWSLDQSPQFRS
jgi:hypothetical protein